jgi:fucose permease
MFMFMHPNCIDMSKVGAAVMELVINVIAFRTATGAVHRAKTPNISVAKVSRTKEAMKNNITWICAFFLLGYVGVEVSLGGWLVEFMLRMRNADAFAAGMTATGFWLGLTVGRVILGFVTGRIGEKLAIALYLLLCMGLELMFWLIPSFISSAVFSGFLGFFLGPLFPAAIVVATKCLPRHLHVSAIGFAAAFGGGGAAVLPFAVGAIAQAKGVQVLQPIVLAFLAVILALWCSLPGGFRKKGLDEVQTHIEGGTETHALSNSIRRIRKRVGMM